MVECQLGTDSWRQKLVALYSKDILRLVWVTFSSDLGQDV